MHYICSTILAILKWNLENRPKAQINWPWKIEKYDKIPDFSNFLRDIGEVVDTLGSVFVCVGSSFSESLASAGFSSETSVTISQLPMVSPLVFNDNLLRVFSPLLVLSSLPLDRLLFSKYNGVVRGCSASMRLVRLRRLTVHVSLSIGRKGADMARTNFGFPL